MILSSSHLPNFLEGSEFSKLSQVGMDLSIARINQINSHCLTPEDKLLINWSAVLTDSTYIAPETYTPVEIEDFYEELFFHYIPKDLTNNKPKYGFYLEPGYYDFQFNENITLDECHTGILFQRSSLARMGVIFSKSIFDPGFSTQGKGIGTSVYVHNHIFLELNSRVGQMVIFENHPTEKYQGQFFGEKQREFLK